MGRTHCHVTQLKGTFLNEDLTFHKYQREEFEASSSSLPLSQQVSLLLVPRFLCSTFKILLQRKLQSVGLTDGN